MTFPMFLHSISKIQIHCNDFRKSQESCFICFLFDQKTQSGESIEHRCMECEWHQGLCKGEFAEDLVHS